MMASFEHEGSRVYYEDAGGTGEPLLLLPGWGGSIEEFAGLREGLSNYRVIAADLPGCGKSGPQPREYTPSYYADDATSFLALLKSIDASPAHLIGFSDGGECALLMAATAPVSIRSVVTWGSGGTLANIPEMADAMVSIIDSPPPPMKEFAEYLKMAYGEDNARAMTRSFGTNLRTMIEAGGDISRSRAANIACPALLITGEHDMFAPPPLVSEMAAAVARGEFIEAKGASHPIHHEQPAWLTETIVDWLSKR
jgi:valacyclovir hydrolase